MPITPTDDEVADSTELSHKMETAGFKSANAAVQAGMALALQDIIRFLMQTDNFHVFGSFCDGWGSCPTRLDGTISNSSDIDVTIIVDNGKPLHPKDGASSESDCKLSSSHTCLDYEDGHVCRSVSNDDQAEGPNLPIMRYDIMNNVDLIMALPCCNYPRIELLQPGYKSRTGYKSRMSTDIMQALRTEVHESPRCHVVAASPPGLEGSRMRVSTTLLERIVMHNLTTIQGQFFILIKFLIKKVISKRVNGLKTYMAKNLLFYMLDETPAEDWKPQNLLTLVRQSLQMLVAMMESSDSDHVCMTHFFLRDAAVYLKHDHDSKSNIVDAVIQMNEQLQELLAQFQKTFPAFEINVVLFSVIAFVILHIEILDSGEHSFDSFSVIYDSVHEIKVQLRLSREASECFESEMLKQLLIQVEVIPDCASVTRECFRAMVLCKMGKLVTSDYDSTSTSLGYIRCPEVDGQLSINEAKEIVLSKLHQMTSLGLTVSDGRIASFPKLTEEFQALAVLGERFLRGHAVSIQEVMLAAVSGPKLAKFLLSYAPEYDNWKIGFARVGRHLERFLQKSQTLAAPTESAHQRKDNEADDDEDTAD